MMRTPTEITTWMIEGKTRALELDKTRSVVRFICSTFTHMTASALHVTSMGEDYGVRRCTTYDS